VSPVRVAQPDGSWAPVDYTLVQTGAGWVPRVSASPNRVRLP
jgi:hypothetical protein